MRSCTASILLALLLLAPALAAVPAGQQTTVLRPLTLTATFHVEPGDAVAPHIYDWYFDGVDDYVSLAGKLFSGVYNTFTFSVWVSPLRFDRGVLVLHRAGLNDQGLVPSSPNRFYFLVMSGGVRYELYSDALQPATWYNVVGSYDGSTQRIYVDGVLRNSRPLTVNVNWDLNYIGTFVGVNQPAQPWSAYFNGYIAQVLVYSRSLSDTEIAQAYSGVVSSNGLVLFLDATFYDGTRYIDLSGYGNHGVGYGGVSRVLSDRPGLYLVKGLHGDGLVHFRFFPVNTVVDVYDATTNSPVTSFVIDGPANPAGMVEDYAVSLPPGTYRLAIYTSVYVQVAQPSLPAMKLVAAHFKATFGPGCRVYIDYTAWPKAEPRAECGLQTDVVFLTGLPAGATVRLWNETTMYELTASSTGVVILGRLKHGEYEVKVYSDTLSIPYDHLLRLDPLTGLRQFFGFWDRLTFSLFTPVFVVGLVLAVYLRTWSAILTALVALVAHIVLAPDNLWIRGLLALALAVAVYIAVWRRTSMF